MTLWHSSSRLCVTLCDGFVTLFSQKCHAPNRMFTGLKCLCDTCDLFLNLYLIRKLQLTKEHIFSIYHAIEKSVTSVTSVTHWLKNTFPHYQKERYQMSRNPRLFKNPTRLIVNIEQRTVDSIDQLMKAGYHHQHRNRAEFVRIAIERELARLTQV